ncbi:hypothetical protein JYU34_007231 [Plutella xylostella]|uniref:Uncharacterized protein n=1 Tax=Plutella xylostella TaxID=51655 RepID=A0ABQ7QPX0_PLUXY|nr:hypothetical protein JYU34_007231 [Plutella xylostella]
MGREPGARASCYLSDDARGRYISAGWRRGRHSPSAPGADTSAQDATRPFSTPLSDQIVTAPAMARLLLLLLALTLASVHAAPFFDAIYDAINGNARRSYGYSGYGNSDYYGNYYRGHAPRHAAPAEREGKSWKSICRSHFPDAIGNPGAGGIVCPY